MKTKSHRGCSVCSLGTSGASRASLGRLPALPADTLAAQLGWGRWLLAFETRLGQEQGVYDNSLGSITPLTFFPGEN